MKVNFKELTYVLSISHSVRVDETVNVSKVLPNLRSPWISLQLNMFGSSIWICTQLTCYLLSKRTGSVPDMEIIGCPGLEGSSRDHLVIVWLPQDTEGTQCKYTPCCGTTLRPSGFSSVLTCWISTDSRSCKDIPAQAQQEAELPVHSHHAAAELRSCQGSKAGY